jgi:hypothetical protein
MHPRALSTCCNCELPIANCQLQRNGPP